MRHRKSGRRLGRNSSHRKAMFRNMATSLLEHGRIQTTDSKAKELRRVVERLITLSKRVPASALEAASGDAEARLIAQRLHAIRRARRWITDRDVLQKLFDEYGERYQDRPGGYTRITKVGRRTGDNAPMSIIELVEEACSPRPTKKKAPKAEAKAAPAEEAAEDAAEAAPAEEAAEVAEEAAPAEEAAEDAAEAAPAEEVAEEAAEAAPAEEAAEAAPAEEAAEAAPAEEAAEDAAEAAPAEEVAEEAAPAEEVAEEAAPAEEVAEEAAPAEQADDSPVAQEAATPESEDDAAEGETADDGEASEEDEDSKD